MGELMKIIVHYNPDILWANAPLYANRGKSIPRWERQAFDLLRLDGYTVIFVEDYDLPVAWKIDGACAEDMRVIGAALAHTHEGEWCDYSRQERADYEYGVRT